MSGHGLLQEIPLPTIFSEQARQYEDAWNEDNRHMYWAEQVDARYQRMMTTLGFVAVTFLFSSVGLVICLSEQRIIMAGVVCFPFSFAVLWLLMQGAAFYTVRKRARALDLPEVRDARMAVLGDPEIKLRWCLYVRAVSFNTRFMKFVESGQALPKECAEYLLHYRDQVISELADFRPTVAHERNPEACKDPDTSGSYRLEEYLLMSTEEFMRTELVRPLTPH